MKKFLIIALVFVSILISSCSQNYSFLRVEEIVYSKKTIALSSFTFPKSMTNYTLDRLKYLNTQIYSDYVLNSFISNFNSQNELIKLVTLESVIGSEDFSKLEYHSILGADYVAATGTIATNILDSSTINLLKGKVDGYMFADASMSFWAQKVTIDFSMFNLDGTPIWIDELEGSSYYIIGDAGPTKQTAYDIIVADILEYQKRHKNELYIVIDQAVSNAVIELKDKVPYAFNTNEIIFTQKFPIMKDTDISSNDMTNIVDTNSIPTE